MSSWIPRVVVPAVGIVCKVSGRVASAFSSRKHVDPWCLCNPVLQPLLLPIAACSPIPFTCRHQSMMKSLVKLILRTTLREVVRILSRPLEAHTLTVSFEPLLTPSELLLTAAMTRANATLMQSHSRYSPQRKIRSHYQSCSNLVSAFAPRRT